MKKIMFFMLGIMALLIVVKPVSAEIFQFDNAVEYSDNDMTATIKNTFGVGVEFGKMSLKSHKSVHEVLNVAPMPGTDDGVVMIYETDFRDKYANGLGEVIITDMHTGKKVQKDYYFATPVYSTRDISVCEKAFLANGSQIWNCQMKPYTEITGWQRLENNDIPAGKTTIGLITDVKQGDWYDGIWTVAGKKIDKHAEWTADLNTGLVAYWNFDTDATDQVTGTYSGTTVSATQVTNASCLLNGCYYFNGTGYIDTVGTRLFNNDFTINLWVKSDDTGSYDVLISKTQYLFELMIDQTADKMWFNYAPAAAYIASTTTVNNGSWQMATASRNSTSDTSLYINGNLEAVLIGDATDFDNDTQVMRFGQRANPGGEPMIGYLDEPSVHNVALTQAQITQLFNNGAGISYKATGFGIALTVSLDDPLNNTISSARAQEFDSSFSLTDGNFINSTLEVWYLNGSLFSLNTTLLDGTENFSNLSISDFIIPADYEWNYYICVENSTDVECKYAPDNYTFSTTANITNFSYSEATYHSKSESYSATVEIEGETPTNTIFVYNNENSTATLTDLGSNLFNVSASRNVGTINEPADYNFSFYFDLAAGGVQSINYTQTQAPINFSLCNSAPMDVSYINFSFKNETVDQEQTTAAVSATFYYWIDNVGDNKSLAFSNSSENLDYNFCFNPGNETLNLVTDMVYSNSESPQRSVIETSLLTNTTTQKVLYLLSSYLGLYSQFKTEDIAGNALQEVGAVISRTLGGTSVDIAADYTDSSGVVVFFLNPDMTYNAIFSKTGYSNNEFSFVPITDSRTVVMGSTSSGDITGSNISINMSYEVTPVNDTLLNNTLYTFGFNVTGNSEITLISMNITNGSGYQLSYQSNAGVGYISDSIDTSDNSTLMGVFIIQNADETITFVKRWIIGDYYEGDYSMKVQLGYFLDYGFRDIWKYIIVLFSLVAIVMFMSSKGNISDNVEIKVAVIVLAIWFWSVLGWLEISSVTSTTGLAVFAKQYGIAILSSMSGAFFFLRRIFI